MIRRDDDRYRGLIFRGAQADRQSERLRRLPLRPVRSSRAEESHPTSSERRFLEFVFESAGCDLSAYRLAPLARRLSACLRALKVSSLDGAEERLKAEPVLGEVAMNTLLIGATAFFRDPPVFENLRRDVLPQLCNQRQRPRVLSVACSDGSEVLTVAILLEEMGQLASSELCGLDCRPAALEAARRGVYPPSALKQLPQDLQQRHFVGERSDFRIRRELLDHVRWQVMDVRNLGEGKWDLILCRNLAIYLQTEAARGLWSKLANLLSAGGYLVAGKAEKPHLRNLVPVGPCIYQKRS